MMAESDVFNNDANLPSIHGLSNQDQVRHISCLGELRQMATSSNL